LVKVFVVATENLEDFSKEDGATKPKANRLAQFEKVSFQRGEAEVLLAGVGDPVEFD